VAKKRRKQHERRRRRLLAAAVHEPYTLAEIAARDRYTCGLCRKSVPMTLRVPHPKAPTIDHLVPVSDGGDDTRANVQLAHFICNSRRGAGGVVQLALLG
jgi:5-methylcytosine-specific restriction endonuclease McrA